jgi:hypothetical protein
MMDRVAPQSLAAHMMDRGCDSIWFMPTAPRGRWCVISGWPPSGSAAHAFLLPGIQLIGTKRRLSLDFIATLRVERNGGLNLLGD